MNLKNLKRTYQMLVQDPFKNGKKPAKALTSSKKPTFLPRTTGQILKYGLVATSATASM